MIHLEQAIVVEGKYDRIRLASVVDALIIETGGFRIYQDTEKKALLRRMAKERGLVILTDSDAAGFQIRGYLRSIIEDKDHITEVYVPELYGKEKRKEKPSKEGKLGVEGMSEEILLNAFERAGLVGTFHERASDDNITQVDFFEWGLTGGENSREKRSVLLKKLDFPLYLSGKALLNAINALYSKNSFEDELKNWEIIE